MNVVFSIGRKALLNFISQSEKEMFCPRCSQEQASENLRYCSRCGLPLDVVSSVVENGGNPDHLVKQEEKRKVFSRRNGLLFSLLWFVLFIMFIVPFLLMSDVNEELIAIIAAIGMFGSIFLLIVSLFLDKTKDTLRGVLPGKSETETRHLEGIEIPSLQAGQQIYTKDYVSASGKNTYETGEMKPSISVVEETTKLLRKEEE